MKTPKIITLALLIGLISTVCTFGQIDRCWRIINGKGAGFIVGGTGTCGFGPCAGNSDVDAAGFIAEGHFDDCECTDHAGHYHGTLFGIPDPDPNGCGWGCVDEIPCDLNQAL